MKRGCLATIGFIGGAVAGWALCILLYVVGTSVFGYQDFEGAAAMGVAFTMGPAIGVMTGILGALWLSRRRRNG